MFEKTITNDSYNVLCIIYEAYLQRRNNGISKNQARDFTDYELFRREYIPDIHSDDMYSAIVELKNNGYVKLYVDGGFLLSDDGIVLMENKFKNNLSDVMDFISNIPFIRKVL